MEKKEILAKLLALQKSISQWTSTGNSFLEPDVFLSIFDRFARLRDILRSEYASTFDDLPVHPRPTVKRGEYDGGQYISTSDSQSLFLDIKYCIELLSNTEDSVALPDITREGVFFAGQYFDAFQRATEILSQAQQEIVIIDGYIGESVLKMLTAKNTTVNVRILTLPQTMTASLTTAANVFNQQYPSLNISTTKAFHDRFLIIDDTHFFHFGASIKDLGNKGFMFSRLEELQVIQLLRAKVAQEWASAMVVV